MDRDRRVFEIDITTGDFTDPVIREVISGNTTVISGLDLNTQYKWRCKDVLDSGIETKWSAVRYFNTVYVEPVIPIDFTKVDGQYTSDYFDAPLITEDGKYLLGIRTSNGNTYVYELVNNIPSYENYFDSGGSTTLMPCISKNHLFIPQASATQINLIDITDPTTAITKSPLSTGIANKCPTRQSIPVGDYVHCVGDGILTTIDITDIDSITVSAIDVGNSDYTGIANSGAYIYILEEYLNIYYITIYNISNGTPSFVKKHAIEDTSIYPIKIIANDGYLYIYTSYQKIAVYNIASPENPSFISLFEGLYESGASTNYTATLVSLDSNYILCTRKDTSGYAAIYAINISNKNSLSIADNTEDELLGFTINNNYLYTFDSGVYETQTYTIY